MLGWLWKSPRCHWIKRELCTRTHLRRGTQGAVKNRFWMETRCPNALYNSAGGILQSCGLPTTSKQSGKIYWLVNNSHTLAKGCYLKFHTSVKCIEAGGTFGWPGPDAGEGHWVLLVAPKDRSPSPDPSAAFSTSHLPHSHLKVWWLYMTYASTGKKELLRNKQVKIYSTLSRTR